MKMKNLLTSFIAVMLVGTIVFGLLNDKNTSVYKKRIGDASFDSKGMQEWLWNRRANLQTGQMDYDYINKVNKQMHVYNSKKASNDFTLEWKEMGPDKVGGRTRSILVDKNNTNTLYAGAVSGGLWKSTDAGGSWKKVNADATNLVISSIVQTDNGDIYYGTGEAFGTGFKGDGIWKSTDNGNTFEQLTSSTGFSNVYKMVVKTNKVYAATSEGLHSTSDGGTTWTKLHPHDSSKDVAIGTDGTVYTMILGKAYKSSTGDEGSFTKMDDIPDASGGRMIFATAPSNPNYVYCSVAYISSNNPFGSNYNDFDIFKSTDKGATWTSIRGAYSETFQPFKHQAIYDNIIAVYPDDENKILLGGVELYTWNNTSVAWEKVSCWNCGSQEINFVGVYLHADLHEIVFDPNYSSNKRIYFGNDGGVFVSNDGAVTYTSMNLKYNVTQFYDVGFGPKGEIIGGSQDNGTQYNNLDGYNKQRSTEILGGDGFSCDISKLNNDIKFATIYHGQLYRIVGEEIQQMLAENSNNPFHTDMSLWESYYDDMSIDSIYYAFTDSVKEYVPSGDTVIKVLWQRGDTIIGKSSCGLKPIPHILDENDWTSPMDTIFKADKIVKIWDYYQAAIAISLNTGIWVSSLPVNLGVSGLGRFLFVKLVEGNDLDGNTENLSWTADGDILYFSEGPNVYRVSGIKFARELVYINLMRKKVTTYDPDKVKVQLLGNLGNKVTSISVDPNVSNNVVVTTGSYSVGSHIFYSTNAAVTNSELMSSNFISIQGSLPEIPAFSGLISWNDSRKAVVGTEYGVYTTDDLTADPVTWVLQNTGLPMVATNSLKQEIFVNDWRTGIENHGFIYAGTFGRGAFRSESNAGPVSIPEMPSANVSNISNINIYPNPVSSIGNIYIKLEKSSRCDISIYNLSGQSVYTSSYNGVKGENTMQFNVNGLDAGVYFVKVSNGNNIEIKKIVVK